MNFYKWRGFSFIELLLVTAISSAVLLAGGQLFIQQLNYYTRAEAKLAWYERVRLVHFHLTQAVTLAGSEGCFKNRSQDLGLDVLLPGQAPLWMKSHSASSAEGGTIHSSIVVSRYIKILGSFIDAMPLTLKDPVDYPGEQYSYFILDCRKKVQVLLKPWQGRTGHISIQSFQPSKNVKDELRILQRVVEDASELGVLQTDYYFFNESGGFVKCAYPGRCFELVQDLGLANINLIQSSKDSILKLQLRHHQSESIDESLEWIY